MITKDKLAISAMSNSMCKCLFFKLFSVNGWRLAKLRSPHYVHFK